MPAGILGQTGSGTAYALTVNGSDILPHIPLDGQLSWVDESANDVGQMTFTVEDQAAWASRIPLPRGANVSFFAKDGTTAIFGGVLLDVVYRRDRPTGRYADVTVASHDWWLDHRIVPRFQNLRNVGGRVRKISRDREVVQALMDRRGAMILAPDSTVDVTNSAMPEMTIEGVKVREALEQIADEAQNAGSTDERRFYVDAQRRLHWFAGSEGLAAPYTVGPAADIEVEDLEIEYDSFDVVHHVYVRGKEGKRHVGGSGWVYNTGSDFQLGAVSDFLDAPHSDTVGSRNRRGRAFLRRHAEVVSGSFVTLGTSGWRAGQYVTITDDQLGLSSDVFRIARVMGTFEVSGAVLSHTIEFGAVRRSVLRDLRRRRLL